MEVAEFLGGLATAVSDNKMAPAMHNETSNTNNQTDSTSNIVLGLIPLCALLIGIVGLPLVDYVLHDLIFTLAAVEAPVPGGAGSEKYGLLNRHDTNQKRFDELKEYRTDNYYISSGIRSTFRHLQSEAGDLSIFRGIGTFFISTCFFHVVVEIATVILASPLKWLHLSRALPLVVRVIAALPNEQIDTAWTHMVISKPRHKFWFRRLPLSLVSIIRMMWVPVVLGCLLHTFVDWVPTLWSAIIKLPRTQGPTKQADKIQLTDGPVVSIGLFYLAWALLKVFLSTLITPALQVIFHTPLSAAYRRMHASLLPDDDDPIISIDRSFTGRPSSGILHRAEPLDFKRACQTIDKPTYIRLVKLNFKIYLIKQILVALYWASVSAFVACLIGRGASLVVLKLLLGVPIVQQDFQGIQGTGKDVLSGFINIRTVELHSNLGIGSDGVFMAPTLASA
ncbi:hypothetical protein MBLNU459_g4774t1 [Dothideomycetes sp. NU459]